MPTPAPPPGPAWQPGAPQPGPAWQPAPAPQPTSTLALIGFITALVPCTTLVGLVVSIVALVRIRRGAATGRGLAIAGVVLAVLWLVAAVVAVALGVTTLVQTCAELGDGVHQVDGVTYTCDV